MAFLPENIDVINCPPNPNALSVFPHSSNQTGNVSMNREMATPDCGREHDASLPFVVWIERGSPTWRYSVVNDICVEMKFDIMRWRLSCVLVVHEYENLFAIDFDLGVFDPNVRAQLSVRGPRLFLAEGDQSPCHEGQQQSCNAGDAANVTISPFTKFINDRLLVLENGTAQAGALLVLVAGVLIICALRTRDRDRR
ncbi:MAG TPA: hypothetical protein VLV50_14960 [Stellaceae bacterium]|nr:hypothetical protein [Stellaceae bacterium]